MEKNYYKPSSSYWSQPITYITINKNNKTQTEQKGVLTLLGPSKTQPQYSPVHDNYFRCAENLQS